MAVYVLTNAYAFAAGYDFTSDSNRLAMTTDADPLDTTAYGSDWKSAIGGLKSTAFDMGGFWQSAASQAVDPEAFSALGVADQVFTFGTSAVEGDPAFLWQGMKAEYSLGGQVGDVAPYSLKAVGSNGVGAIRGKLTKSRGNVNATGPLGTGVLLAAASASQKVYASLHIFTAATTVTLQLQSDDNAGFTSPATIATIGPITMSGGTWVTPVPGPLTDTYFRLNVSAITGTFNMAAAIGVQ
jgi:hypothetical protein